LDPRLLATACEAALRAGAIQKERYGAAVQVTHKGVIDIVTEVDHACEAAVLDVLQSTFPDHDVMTEEQDIDRRGRSHVWCIDPLDGTLNYAHAYPFFCVSVGLMIDGRRAVGAVYDPLRDELFTAERGEGSRLNGRRLQVARRESLLQALLMTGFPYDIRDHLDERLRLFVRFMGEAQAVRRDGAAALDLCYLGAGRIDGFWEEQLKPWDVVAGALVAEEAGAIVTRYDGSEVREQTDEIVVANPLLHARMLEVLARTPGSARS
jgi:myo-inositol-1(or 4)-monophosphatase